MPVLPVRDIVLFPGVIAPLFVGRPRSLKALEECMLKDKKVFIVAQRDMQVDEPGPEDFFTVGTVCQVLQMTRVPDGSTKALVEGLYRGKAEDYTLERDYYEVFLPENGDQAEGREEDDDEGQMEALRRSALEQFEHYVSLHPKIPNEVIASVSSVDNTDQLADIIASHALLKVDQKQRLLEIGTPEQRLEELLKLLMGEVEILELEHNIHDRVRQEMEHSQREYYLREQLKIIQDELGTGEGSSEIQEFKEHIKKAKMPKDVERKAYKETERLSKMPGMSAEATVVRTYIDWLTSLPWQKQSKDILDISRAQKVLNEDHYGLDEIKERILEFLAIRKQARQGVKGQVLCFVGPPGVGKTSLGKSIARALN
ncbi:MAG: LON peptidase substrate-binding domain-containing protein, partial [Synergistales bacterium]|nr:LON peptidase substrate-binding domain-containing protein [Synergistales bacterium]